MKINITKKQLEHIITCLQYCEGKIINYGNIGINKFSYKVNYNLLKKLDKDDKCNMFIQ